MPRRTAAQAGDADAALHRNATPPSRVSAESDAGEPSSGRHAAHGRSVRERLHVPAGGGKGRQPRARPRSGCWRNRTRPSPGSSPCAPAESAARAAACHCRWRSHGVGEVVDPVRHRTDGDVTQELGGRPGGAALDRQHRIAAAEIGDFRRHSSHAAPYTAPWFAVISMRLPWNSSSPSMLGSLRPVRRDSAAWRRKSVRSPGKCPVWSRRTGKCLKIARSCSRASRRGRRRCCACSQSRTSGADHAGQVAPHAAASAARQPRREIDAAGTLGIVVRSGRRRCRRRRWFSNDEAFQVEIDARRRLLVHLAWAVQPLQIEARLGEYRFRQHQRGALRPPTATLPPFSSALPAPESAGKTRQPSVRAHAQTCRSVHRCRSSPPRRPVRSSAA